MIVVTSFDSASTPNSLTTLCLQGFSSFVCMVGGVLCGSVFWPLFVLLASLPRPCVLAHKWSHDPARPIEVFPGSFVRIIRKPNSPFLETVGFKNHVSLELPMTIFSRSRELA